jgi:tetratricopeptide (TPR) repeat protein
MPAAEPEPGDRDDGPVCWVCQFTDCEGRPEEALLSTGCACCREGSSGGWVHVSCLAGAAAHQEKLWTTCPTCKQCFSGAAHLALSRAHWELYRNRPEADAERLEALSNVAAALQNEGDYTTALPLYEELVAVGRRVKGDGHPVTLQDIGGLGNVLGQMGKLAEAQTLLEEAVAGLRLAKGGEHETTLEAMGDLSLVHSMLGAWAKNRLLLDESLAVRRRIQPASPNTFTAICNLGGALAAAGDIVMALALREEAAVSARQVLGPEHSCTQRMVELLVQARQRAGQCPTGTRARGTLVGLASKPELNGAEAFVVGFDVGKGNFRTGKPIGIKPTNLIFDEGSAVIVEGLDAAPEWNGKRGLVESYDAAKGRYQLLVEGRMKALGVRAACCKLEFAVEQERREHEAMRRAQVQAAVSAALALRKQQELEPEQQPHKG